MLHIMTTVLTQKRLVLKDKSCVVAYFKQTVMKQVFRLNKLCIIS